MVIVTPSVNLPVNISTYYFASLVASFNYFLKNSYKEILVIRIISLGHFREPIALTFSPPIK